MFTPNLINSPSFIVNKDIINKVFKTIWQKIKIPQNWVLNIVFVDENHIKELNNNYRKINKETDVLSSHYFEDFSKIKNEDTAWEIILCENKIISQWIEYLLWSEKEFYKLIIHSVLHILWFDHEEDNDYKTMSELENIIWKEIFVLN
jgi:probable rRNA maturation factor